MAPNLYGDLVRIWHFGSIVTQSLPSRHQVATKLHFHQVAITPSRYQIAISTSRNPLESLPVAAPPSRYQVAISLNRPQIAIAPTRSQPTRSQLHQRDRRQLTVHYLQFLAFFSYTCRFTLLKWFPASSGPLPCQPHNLVLYIGFAPGELWENNQSILYITSHPIPSSYFNTRLRGDHSDNKGG